MQVDKLMGIRENRFLGSKAYQAACAVLPMVQVIYLGDMSLKMWAKYSHLSEVGNGLVFILPSTVYTYLGFGILSLGFIVLGATAAKWRRGWVAVLLMSILAQCALCLSIVTGLIRVI